LRRPAAEKFATARLDGVAAALAGNDYLVGGFTVADLLMCTVLRFLRHTKMIEEHPVLGPYKARCEARPAFQRALDAQMANFVKDDLAKVGIKCTTVPLEFNSLISNLREDFQYESMLLGLLSRGRRRTSHKLTFLFAVRPCRGIVDVRRRVVRLVAQRIDARPECRTGGQAPFVAFGMLPPDRTGIRMQPRRRVEFRLGFRLADPRLRLTPLEVLAQGRGQPFVAPTIMRGVLLRNGFRGGSHGGQDTPFDDGEGRARLV